MAINLIKSILRYFRVKDWRAYFLMIVFGFIVAKGFLAPFFEIFLFFVISILLLAFGFAINNFFDVKEDKEKGETKEILIQNKKNFFLSVSPGILALFLSLHFGWKIFLFVLLTILIGFFYSAPPLRFKSRPFLDLISHGLFGGALLFFFPLLVFDQKLSLFHYFVALSLFYLSMMLETRNHLEDYQSDLRAGLRTTVCFLGYRNSHTFLKYLSFFYPLTLLPSFLFFPAIISFFFLIITSFFLFVFLLKKHYPIMDKYYSSFSYLLMVVLLTFYGKGI